MNKQIKSPVTNDDNNLIIRESQSLLGRFNRRHFLKQFATLGGLSLLTGCSISDNDSVEKLLGQVSRFNDKAQAWLFDPNKLAPTYSESQITRPFPFNAYYSENKVPQVNAADFQLEVSGRVSNHTS